MKRCGHLEADTNETMQVIPELRREVRVAVTDNVVREPVELVYLVKDKLRDVFSAVGSARRCQVHHGCEMINENTDHVEMSMAIRRRRQRAHKIHPHGLPGTSRHRAARTVTRMADDSAACLADRVNRTHRSQPHLAVVWATKHARASRLQFYEPPGAREVSGHRR